MPNYYFSAAVLTDEDVVMLRKRTEGANAGKWELPFTALDVTCENFQKAAARMVAGEMKVPLTRVETLAVMSRDDLEGYDGNVDMTFFVGLIEKGADLSHLEADGWTMVPINGLGEDDVVPEHVVVFEALGTKMATAPDTIVPIERN